MIPSAPSSRLLSIALAATLAMPTPARAADDTGGTGTAPISVERLAELARSVSPSQIGRAHV